MPNMTVADILKIHGDWIESKQLVFLITQKMEIDERQAYRKIKDAFKNNEIKKAQLPDRSVLYGLPKFGPLSSEKTSKLSSVRTLNFNDAFLYNSFRKLDKISSAADGQHPEGAFRELMFFIATLPKELKEKIKPLQDQAIEAVKEKGKGRWEPQYGLAALLDRDNPNDEFLTACYHEVLKLVGEISSLLHELNKEKLK
jgi:hypothetical protein